MGVTSAEPVPHSPGLDAVQSLLIPGERLETYAIQHRLFALTHRRLVVGATSGRLIAVQRGLISGFTTQDIRWQDLRDAQLQVGIFGATLNVTADPGEDLAGAQGSIRTLRFGGLRKEQAQEVYRACQFQEQSWREKRRVRELEEMRAKSGGVHLGGSVRDGGRQRRRGPLASGPAPAGEGHAGPGAALRRRVRADQGPDPGRAVATHVFGDIGMPLFVVRHSHQGERCPAQDPYMGAMLPQPPEPSQRAAARGGDPGRGGRAGRAHHVPHRRGVRRAPPARVPAAVPDGRQRGRLPRLDLRPGGGERRLRRAAPRVRRRARRSTPRRSASTPSTPGSWCTGRIRSTARRR